MTSDWLQRPRLFAMVSLTLLLVLLVACGSAAPEPAPEPAPASQASEPAAKAEPAAPAETKQEAPAPAAPAQPAARPTPLPTPTAVAQAALAPVGEEVAGPREAPDFASYWKADTDFYGQPVYGGTLRINYEDPLEHANVWGARSGVTIRYRTPTHDLLIQDNPYDSASPLIPGLAYGWTVDDDLKGVTFYLRDGVKWHNGDLFACEDARFSYETMITEEGITGSYMKGRLSTVDLSQTECVDDTTLKFRFTVPSAVPLLNFGNPAALIFNKQWFLDGGEEVMFQDVTVGTGPFIWGEGQKVGVDEQHFERNPDYYIDTLPYVDNLVVFGILDESAQQAAMLSHQTDWHWVRNFGQYDAYVQHDQIQTVIRATRSSENLWMNLRNPPLDNVNIRRAIAMGFDRKAAIAVSLAGYGSEGLGLMPPGSFWGLPESDACGVPGWCQPDDVAAQREQAIQMLKDEGFNFDKVYVLTVESDAQRVGRATVMQEQLRLLGIQTEFDLVETIAYRKQRQAGDWGDFMASTGGVAGIDDPYLGLGHYHRCDSLFNFQTPGTECDATSEALFKELSGAVEPAVRKELGHELQLYLMNQYWNFPVMWEEEAVAFWPEVRGYSHFPGPTSSHLRWAHMWIDPARYDDTGFSGQITGVPGGK